MLNKYLRCTLVVSALLWTAGGLAAATSDTLLVLAAKNNDEAAVKSLLSHRHLDVNAIDSEGMTALLWAAHWDDLETVKCLVAVGANVKATNGYDHGTALHEAATFGDSQMISVLLKAGADVNAVRGEDDTPLMVAARAGVPEAVKLLLDHGAIVDAREGAFGETPLMMAAAGNYAAVARILIDHGADVNAISTVMNIRHRPSIDATRRIDPSTGGLTPLLFAARQDALDAAKVLVAAGADVNKSEPEIKFTPLLDTIVNNHYDFATFLIENGANVKDGSLYALMEMRSGTKNGRVLPLNFEQDSLRVAELLIDHGADVNGVFDGKFPDDFYFTIVPAGTTPFFKAAETADVAGMRLLIAKGARPIPLRDGTTPLMALAKLGSRENPVATTLPPVEVLEQTIQLCMQLGFDVNATTVLGDTALHYAAQNGHDQLVQYLVEKGGKLDVANKKGLTPLNLAQGKRGGKKGIESGASGADLPPLESTVALLQNLMTTTAASQ
jgi:uncharacterized protein